MEEEAEVEAVDIDHDGLLLPEVSPLIPVKLQITILIEPLLLVANGDIVEDVDLRGYFGVMGDKLDFFDVDDSVEFEGYLLRVGAETAGLPALRSSE